MLNKGDFGRSSFVIKSTCDALLVIGGIKFFKRTISMAELHTAWIEPMCTMQHLRATHIILEGDTLTVVRWLSNLAITEMSSYLLIQDC